LSVFNRVCREIGVAYDIRSVLYLNELCKLIVEGF
jgi:hypothetical protein